MNYYGGYTLADVMDMTQADRLWFLARLQKQSKMEDQLMKKAQKG